jgi:hypothetical protein
MTWDLPPKIWLPAKPAIIRPAPVQKANFLPGMFPGLMMAAAATPAGYSFTMTAEDGGPVIGYDIGVIGTFGSIDAEPIPGETLLNLFSGFVNNIAFSGDLTSLLSGLTVWVDDVEYPFDLADWTYQSGGDVTDASWDEAGPVFVDSNMYFVEIKATS